MKHEFLIESLNVKNAEALTLEKAEDRMEFEALIFFSDSSLSKKELTCSCYTATECWDWW